MEFNELTFFKLFVTETAPQLIDTIASNFVYLLICSHVFSYFALWGAILIGSTRRDTRSYLRYYTIISALSSVCLKAYLLFCPSIHSTLIFRDREISMIMLCFIVDTMDILPRLFIRRALMPRRLVHTFVYLVVTYLTLYTHDLIMPSFLQTQYICDIFKTLADTVANKEASNNICYFLKPLYMCMDALTSIYYFYDFINIESIIMTIGVIVLTIENSL